MIEFIFGLIAAIDNFLSVVVHSGRQAFFQRQFRKNWMETMKSLSAIEACFEDQVMVLENLAEMQDAKYALTLLDLDESEQDEKQVFEEVQKLNREGVIFFKEKLESVQKIKELTQKLIAE